uniref:hyaluronoglucosaminidase n=1 Tax=Callorhinchus milii TaxID=7868 RepID=A0A4W3IX72_CALMI
MQPVRNAPGRPPAFIQASNGTRSHSSSYVPGKVVPVRPAPPPRMTMASHAEWSNSKPDNPAIFVFRGNQQHSESEDTRRKIHRNSFICVGSFLTSFFLASRRVVIRKGQHFRLDSSATVHCITIQDGGSLVFADSVDGSKNISLKSRYILLKDGGALHIGAEKCLYKSRATITLYGRSDEDEEVPEFGKKFLGVDAGGILEMHGTKKLSWTLLTKTLPASGLIFGSSLYTPPNRGLNVYVVDQDTGQVLAKENFDTYEEVRESKRLEAFLKSQETGRIIAIAVKDSAAKNLHPQTKKFIQELLGSNYVQVLSYRQAWALVSVIHGGNRSCNEAVRNYENHDTGGKAVARKEFFTVDGVKFVVSASSEWENEQPKFIHIGEIMNGVDMRAEVGILTRNIVIEGEMEGSCYSNNQCQFFKQDTFGGHLKVLRNFTSVHVSNVELTRMGQQVLGSYPVHFHRCGDVDEVGGYRSPTYLNSLAIHHCFSRCVAVHTTNGLLIKDTIGYDTMGHCFFLEDGIEERNILYHNLGLLTKPGTILPTDRDQFFCTEILDKVYGKYIPVPAADCKAVSTFWIANPNNHLINNAAAGSQDTGIWYLFHKVPTGDSHGLYPENKAELTPLGTFYNNRVHSNFKAGLFIDKGVKTTNASADDPREYLCLDNSARFRPHQDADPQKPRVAALIDRLIAFKNNDHGAWVRGGDIVFQDSGFSDNGVGLTFASDGSFPKDDGSTQEISESLFVGESKNRGSPGGQNKYWGAGGVDGIGRTLPRNKTFPIRGFQIYDGPVHVTKTTFQNFVKMPDRFTSAVGFSLKNPWQLTPKNSLSLVAFDINVSLNVFFCKAGPWFEDCDLDGDKNAVFHDVDGSVTGYRDTYVSRLDNYLVRHPDCKEVTSYNGSICSGKYAQVYVQTWRPQNLTMTIVRDEYPANPMTLRGINQRADFQQYQPVVMLQKGYTIHWNGRAPEETFLYLINFDKKDWIQVGLCYPRSSTFQVMADIYQRQNSSAHSVEDYGAVSTLKELQEKPSERKYYFDNSTGLLFLTLQARQAREGHSYCSVQGCERIKISATMRSQEQSNCRSRAYPKYSQPPKAIIPMPAPISKQCENCGASKVNGTSLPFQTQGFFLVTVDACSGKVTKRTNFTKADATMVKYLRTGISHSIAFFGYKGESKHSWTRLHSSTAGQGLGHLEKYIPLQLEEYGCTKVKKPQRKDRELYTKLYGLAV